MKHQPIRRSDYSNMALSMTEQYNMTGNVGGTNATRTDYNVMGTSNMEVLTPVQTSLILGNVSTPELEQGNVDYESDPVQMEDLEDALQDLCDSVEEEIDLNDLVLNETPKEDGTPEETETEVSGTGSSVYNSSAFNIYNLMALMTELSHDVKQVSREVRYAELEVEQAQILARADYQRKAGLYGMITGIALGLVQVGMMGAGAYKSIKGSVTQFNLKNTNTLTNATQNLAITQKCMPQGNNTVNQMQAKAGLSPEQATNLKNQYFGEADAAKSEYATAKDNANANANALNGELDPGVQQELDTKQGDARAAFDRGMDNFDKAITDKENQVKNLKSQGAPKAEIKQAKSELKAMKKQRGYMKAVQVTEKNSISTEEQIASDLDAAMTNEGHISAKAENNPEYINAGISARKGDMVMQVAMSMSGIFNGITQYVSTTYQASATEQETQEKESEQDMQLAQEMMQSAQGVMDAVLQLARAIVDIESSTNQKIING